MFKDYYKILEIHRHASTQPKIRKQSQWQSQLQ